MSEVKHFLDKDKKDKSTRELLVKTDQELTKQNFKTEFLKKAFLFVGGLIVVLVIIGFSIVNFESRPVASSPSEYQYFEIKKGQTTKSIADELEKNGFIRSSMAFYLSVKSERISLQAGSYKLSASMTTGEIIKKFKKGEVDAFSITIPEGFRNLQSAKLLRERNDIAPEKFIEAATGSEGTLFPDTYVFPVNVEPAKIVKTMKDNYEKKTAELKPTEEQIILASIIEREAIQDNERAKIAAVYKNRSDNNMLLQADPTIRYALDSQTFLANSSVDFDFWQPVKRSDYQNLNSSFNTYKQRGYPPAPICNPGLKSIEAAVKPASDFGDYYYFFHDEKGEIHFSKTLDEHTKGIQEFGVSG